LSNATKFVERWLLCEIALDGRANSGAVILFRSTVISLLIFVPVVGTVAALQPGAIWWTLSAESAATVVLETLPWLGGIFFAVYASLYSRFASQWNYLANLYNQIMQTAVSHPPGADHCEHTKRLRIWQAAFVEDAVSLHLAAKPLFASAIRDMLRHPLVRATFISHNAKGSVAFDELLLALANAGHPFDATSAAMPERVQ
jgi:hypothetical protein